MFREEFENVGNAAKKKIQVLKENGIGYFSLAMLAGMYVGFGIILIFTIGGLADGSPFTKMLMGISFGIALSLVVIAGAELFTGNNFVMASGLLQKKVSLADVIKLWIVCYIGNWCGSIILAVIYNFSGLATGKVEAFIAATSAAKMNAGAMQLFLRGILCNILVCAAVWCGIKCKSETAKLIMVFWCLFAFITSGYEHSIANMTLLTIGLFSPCGQLVTVGGYFYNILIVTLGNMVGGILFMAVPYFLGIKQKEN